MADTMHLTKYALNNHDKTLYNISSQTNKHFEI